MGNASDTKKKMVEPKVKMDTVSKPQKATLHVPAHMKETRWLLIDASGCIVGKLATAISKLLMGKDQPSFNRAVDAKTNVVVINAEKVRFTGQKRQQKKYIRHTGYPKGLRTTTPEDIFASGYPQRVVIRAVSGMIPQNKLRKVMLSRLYVYAGDKNPHAGQNPKEIKLS